MDDCWMGTRISRRGFVGGAVALGSAALLDACSSSSSPSSSATTSTSIQPKVDGDLNLYTWEGYFAPTTISGFAKKYNVKVNQTYITSGDDEFSKVAAGLPFDVAITNSTGLPKLIPSNILRQIDHASLTNYSQVIPFFRNPPYDPGAKYSVGYAMAPFGLAWQTNRVNGLQGTWTDLWRLAPGIKGHAYMVDDEGLGLGVGLMHLGYSENSGTASEVNAAADALIALKPSLGGFVSTNTIESIASGQAWLIPTYTGNVYTAILQSKNPKYIHFELCKEGQLFNADNMSIPMSAKHPGTGLLFIDYMLKPENMVANVNYIGYPVPTTAGLEAYDKLVKKYPFLRVGTDLIDQPDSWQQPLEGARQQLWNQAWAKVQAA